MTTLDIQGTVTDQAGTVYTYHTTATSTAAVDTITAPASVNPASAPAGTTRTLIATAVSSTGSALTFGTPTAPGISFTPIANQPAGQAQWSFVY